MQYENVITFQQMKELLHVSSSTLVRWDKRGILPMHHFPSGRRYYLPHEYQNYINDKKRRGQK